MCDDILILINQEITDSHYANVCFWDGMHWYTNTSFLLNGVMRQYALHHQLMKERRILPDDIHMYQKVSLINALNPLGRIVILTENIHW